MKIHGILVLFFSGCLFHAVGQETMRFHPDPVLFIQEARDFFGTRQPEESRALLSKFESAQKDGRLEENHWIDLARKANLFEKSGARPYPEFYTLLDAFLEVTTSSANRDDYLKWSAWLDKILNQKSKNFKPVMAFLDFSIQLSRKGILYQSSAFIWKVNPGIHGLGVDSIFYITVNQSDLIAKGSGDSTIIRSTHGRFYPETNIFYGQDGQVTWERLNVPAGKVYVSLNKYRLDLSKSVYEIDSVNLHDQRYFTEPLIGRVENKILAGVAPENAGYPKFTSYELRNRIKNIYPGMDYEGGFSLQGLKVLGTGLPGQKSILTVFSNQKPLFRLASTYFSFQPDQARGLNTEASIYLETDSIYHPGLLFLYSGKQKDISLIRDGQGLSPSRFLNSYHRYDINVDLIRWSIGDTLMTMTGLPGSIENKASFESSDFFNIERYNEILITDKIHPVTAVKQCADYLYSRNYLLDDLAKFMGKPEHLVEEMLLRLSFLGFVHYNSETRMVEVQERTYDFLKKNAGQQDYDVIRFESSHVPPEANAILNLRNNHLKVFWVNSIVMSEARNVIVYPAKQTVEIIKDRDLLFDGQIQAGLVHFSGTDFKFDYNEFNIRLNNVGELKMQVYERQTKKNEIPKLADVTSVIEYTRGLLKIDQPANKSGVKAENYPEYPILQTDTNAFVYYDQKEILNGVYPRETFNFNISPFTLRGLNLFTFSDSLIFPGLFVTADIFPPLKLELKHQADHSLGFETLKTPEEGYPVYKGKGRFYNSIAMSRAGLRGSGKLEYLNSVLLSKDFLFLPDQVSTIADMFTVNRDTTQAGNPETKGQQMDVKWYPEGNKLIAKGTKGPLSMYGSGRFDGVLSLQPNSLSGTGTLSFDGYSVTSDTIRLFEDSFDAVDGTLRVFRKTPDLEADTTLAADVGSFLVASHYNGLVEVGKQKAHFVPSGTKANMVFTKNRYEGKPSTFDWDISKGLMTLEDVRFKMASKPSDTLNFKSGMADFILKDLAIKAHSVEYIDVADVRIFPTDRNVVIRKLARIDSLQQATIVSRDTLLGHRITGATVSIIDHKRYNARGYYQYHDVAGRDFAINFSDIQPDRKGVSFGKGVISQESNFTLNPAFKYFGTVQWNNNERYLLFDGQTQLSHPCPNITMQWIRFASRIQPDSVAVPIDSITVNDQNERLFKGFFISNQPVELYSTFVGPHTRYSDQPVISATGLLWYDEKSNLYILSSAAKKAKPETDGPVISMNAKTCETEATGPLNFGVDLGQVKLNGAGMLVHDLKNDSIKGSAIITANFFIDPKILDFMTKSINNAQTLEPVNFGDASFRTSFKNLLGYTVAEDLLKQISLTGKWKKIPDELMHTFVFTDIKFRWNPETGSYQSIGKIGIGNMMGEPVNKKLNGYMEILHRRGGDVFSVYLEIDRQNYFYITYSRGLMQCVAGSGLEKFNTMVRGTKESKRKLKVGQGEPEYQYDIGTYAQVSEFLRRFDINR